jgi:5-methylcytosine-specific restriction endonuclease McrA
MAYNEDIINAVWAKGTRAYFLKEDRTQGMNADNRKDVAGAWMLRDAYGDRNHNEGWEIDHIVPIDRGGRDVLENMQPMHWKNNAYKSTKLMYECINFPVKARGNSNEGV